MTVPQQLPFVGRDREAALLRAALDAALGGQGSTAVISGEAGIGKTRLAELVCHEAQQQEALVLAGRCYDLTETAPFAPWIELFSSYPAHTGLPDIPDRVARCEIGGDVPNQAALFTAISTFLTRVGDVSPVVLLLDDQHWADDASLDLIRFLARQAPDLPLLILIVCRAAELDPTHHFARLLPLLVREARALRLNLRPLSSDDLWALIRPRYQLEADDEVRLTSYLHNRTEGNPFFASELLQTLEEEQVLRSEGSGWALGDLGQVRTPLLVEQIVGARLAQIREDDQQLVAAAAVLGQEVSLARWSEVAETDRPALIELLERTARARLMTETPDGAGARFSHALVRQAVYDRLSPSMRRSLHQRAGSAMATAPAPDPDAVANHLRRSGDARAAEWLVRAGERAERAFSWQASAERLEAAVEALRATDDSREMQGWLLVQAARMHRYTAPRTGLERLEEAGRIAASTGNRALAGTVLWQSGLFHCLEGSLELGVEQLERGVAALRALRPAEQECFHTSATARRFVPDPHNNQATLAMWLAVAGRYHEAITYALPYIADEEIHEATRGGYGDAFVAAGHAYAKLGRSEDSRDVYTLGREAYQTEEYALHLARTLVNELQNRVLPYETDNLAARHWHESEAEAAWKRGRGALADDLAGAPRLPLQCIEGHWAEAHATAENVRAHGTLALRADATRWLGSLARAQGDLQLAWELVEEWLPAGPATSPGDMVFSTALNMQQLAAGLALEAGDLPAARRWLEAVDRWLAWNDSVPGRANSALGWAAYYRASDDLQQARRHAESALDAAGTPRQPLALLAAHRALGEIETADARYAEARNHLDTALTLAEACVAPYEQALTLLALVELDLGRDNASDAAYRLDAARSILSSLDAQPALGRADALAVRLVKGPPVASGGATEESLPASASAQDRELLAELSAREIDVLRLLPAGHTNREIADQLFLSPKTVENHVGRILAKTDLPNRAAAAAFAQRVGIA